MNRSCIVSKQAMASSEARANFSRAPRLRLRCFSAQYFRVRYRRITRALSPNADRSQAPVTDIVAKLFIESWLRTWTSAGAGPKGGKSACLM